MNRSKMRSFEVYSKEIKRDEDGNLMFDKKTGEPIFMRVRRIVWHSPYYFPKKF